MTNITFTAKISERHQKHLTDLFPEVTFQFFDHLEAAREQLPTAEALVTYGEDLNAEIIAECRALRWIHVVSAGLELMPFEAIEARGIRISNARGIHRIPMAEYTIGVMLQITRQMNSIFQNQLLSEWDRSLRVDELHGKTLGIVGVGAIGSKIAEYAKVMGMRVLGVSRSGASIAHVDQVWTHDGLHELLAQSDFVVVVVPLTPLTEGN